MNFLRAVASPPLYQLWNLVAADAGGAVAEAGLYSVAANTLTTSGLVFADGHARRRTHSLRHRDPFVAGWAQFSIDSFVRMHYRAEWIECGSIET